MFINTSPQRRDAFLTLQDKEPKLAPIQDVRIQWNSTYLMLQRANCLRATFEQYCIEHQRPEFHLSKSEWRQIDYLLCITKPFYKFTISLSKIKTTTIHNVFSVYNQLFSHFEQSIARLRRKRVPWKKAMLHALEAGMQKLSVYYKSTEEAHGSLYAIRTILTPQYKLKFFQTPEWQGEVEFEGDLSTWPEIYEKSLHHYLEEYSKHQPERQVLPQRNTIVETEDEMTSLLTEDQPLIPPTQKVTGWQEELKGYLNLDTFSLFWFLFILIVNKIELNKPMSLLEGERAYIPNPCFTCSRRFFYSYYRCRDKASF